MRSPFPRKHLPSFSALPKTSLYAHCPSSPSLTHHLLLATSCSICSSIQLWSTKALHRAPQCLANILENKCEIALLRIFKTYTKAISTVMVKHTHSPTYLQWLLPTTLVCSEQQPSEWTRVMDSNHSRSLSSNLIWTLPSFINSDLQTILGNKKMGDKSHFLKVGTIISICVAQYRCP